MSKNNKRTIAVDFDGVIHAYSKGWHDGTAYDVPMESAAECLEKLLAEYQVFIFSAREPESIQHWMATHMPQFCTQVIPVDSDIKFWNTDNVIGITRLKLPAIVYIDDRAQRFVSWESIMFYKPSWK